MAARDVIFIPEKCVTHYMLRGTRYHVPKNKKNLNHFNECVGLKTFTVCKYGSRGSPKVIQVLFDI